MIIELLCLTFIITFITDCTDFPNSVKYVISKMLTNGKIAKTNYRLHLLDCSLCQTFWLGNLYLLITDNFNIINISIVCGLALFSGVFGNIFLLLKDIINTLISIITDKL